MWYAITAFIATAIGFITAALLVNNKIQELQEANECLLKHVNTLKDQECRLRKQINRRRP